MPVLACPESLCVILVNYELLEIRITVCYNGKV